ncbi:hypothetical protein HJC23_001479 [Cyclotella cryptica]|uniref:Mitochondrial import inner membrane translocase subunit TIM50 n=1 Tax=Cyclotella cryptica TaxID=29204 RepID=A0ABD3NVC4_9STRA|eukprot:CCRYP_019401-RA/>CCRYP_019401-RA protein AED:0.09 eAED:0.09 QI:0/0/0/0.5/1/1/2/0/255
MLSQLLSHARRMALIGTTGITGLATYKAHTDPIHLFWDLDHTILCSISPLPKDPITSTTKQKDSKQSIPIPTPPALEHFDQIDDDFPYDAKTLAPNTRTYFRPGVRTALQLCSYFGILHVYTAAQESYTNNIMKELDPDASLFTKVLHRDEFPAIVKEGKDLSIATDRLDRAILFDDKTSNFKPQRYENGIGVIPYTSDRVEKYLCTDGYDKWDPYLEEVKEMARLVFIAFSGSIHLSGDARKVVSWVRKWSNDR